MNQQLLALSSSASFRNKGLPNSSTFKMGGFSNMKLPSNLDKPPLFQACFRTGYESSSRIAKASGVLAPSNFGDYKASKTESEQFSEEMAHVKRPRLSSDAQHSQILSPQLPAMPSFLATELVGTRSKHIKEEDGFASQAAPVTSHFNPFNEPSPLGLNLRKSPSLLDLIQRRLAQNDETGSQCPDDRSQGTKGDCTSGAEKDKLKAANFPASFLRIGKWECTSRYDGDLVAKCYYAKRKLVWEILDSGLKSKMEIQWSDISALKAIFSEDQPAILDIELSRPPLFFKEINPQPRKHTLWQSTSDFTDGQATICRHHSVHFPVGILNRHFEKLLQCDARLKVLSEQAQKIIDSCFFDSRNVHMDRQQMLHYQCFFPDHATLQPFAIDAFEHEPTPPHALATRSVEGLQNEPFSQTRAAAEGTRSYIMTEGLKHEPLSSAASIHSDATALTGASQMQQSFGGHMSTANSPSSVMDAKGMDESSSSSETEETSKDRSSFQVLDAKTSGHLFGLVSGPLWQMNKWEPSSKQENSQESLMTWMVDGPGAHIFHVSEQEALNELSLHLLDEPISSAEHGYILGKGIHNGLFGAEDSTRLSRMRENQWNLMPENRSLEVGASVLSSHGSFVDMVHLPQIAPLPQFFMPPT